MNNLQSDIQSVIKSIDILVAVAGSGASWETKFDVVFTYAQLILDVLNRIGIDGIIWDSPGPADEDDLLELKSDTLAFVGALKETRDELAIVLSAIEGVVE